VEFDFSKLLRSIETSELSRDQNFRSLNIYILAPNRLNLPPHLVSVRRRPPKSLIHSPSHPSDSTLLPTDLAPPFTAHQFALGRLHELDLSDDATLVEKVDLGKHIHHQQ
jgi:hypothetical protein